MSATTTAAGRRRKRLIPSTARPASLRAGRRAGCDYGAGAQPDWRGVDFAAARRAVQIGGRVVNVIDLGDGDGPPVVFVHGLGGSWKNWLENLPATARHRRSIALDLPGFGDSELPEGEITISGYADAVEAVCGCLELTQIDLLGNSMGGLVAAELAITRPRRVHKLVLVDAAGITSADLRRWPTRTLMRLAAAQAGWAAGQRMIMARPRLRHLAFRSVIRHPTSVAADLVAQQAADPACRGSCSPQTRCWPTTSAIAWARLPARR